MGKNYCFLKFIFFISIFILVPSSKLLNTNPRNSLGGWLTDKKEKIFSSNIRKFIWDRLQSHIWGSFLIYEEMRKYLIIYEEAVSHIELCNRSRGKFYFIFYQCLSPKVQEPCSLCSGYGLESLKKGLRRWVAQYYGWANIYFLCKSMRILQIRRW